MLHSLQFALEADGYGVCAFQRFGEAVASATILECDCLVADYALPDGDGVALIRAMRSRGLTCPAIIITSNPSLRCLRDAEAIGAPVVEKPLMGDILRDRIRASL